jgi:hypothetical protein
MHEMEGRVDLRAQDVELSDENASGRDGCDDWPLAKDSPSQAGAGTVDQASDLFGAAVQIVVHDDMIEPVASAQFTPSELEPRLHGDLILGPTVSQATLELLHRRGDEEHLERLGQVLADLERALDLDLEEHRAPTSDGLLHLCTRRPITIARILRPLEKFPCLDHDVECCIVDEPVGDPIDLTGTWRSCRRRDGDLEVAQASEQPCVHGTLAHPGRAGDDDDQTAACHQAAPLRDSTLGTEAARRAQR